MQFVTFLSMSPSLFELWNCRSKWRQTGVFCEIVPNGLICKKRTLKRTVSTICTCSIIVFNLFLIQRKHRRNYTDELQIDSRHQSGQIIFSKMSHPSNKLTVRVDLNVPVSSLRKRHWDRCGYRSGHLPFITAQNLRYPPLCHPAKILSGPCCFLLVYDLIMG